MSRASEGDIDNTPIINRILELRQEQAKLLGFNNYAEVSMARKVRQQCMLHIGLPLHLFLSAHSTLCT